MNICRGGKGEKPHSPVVYDDDFGKCCPFCIMRENMACQIAELKERIEELNAEIKKLS